MNFSGNVQSDYLKLAAINDEKRESLIDFTAQDFNSIKAALIKYMKAVYPLDFQNFNESDLGIMLTELFSYVGAINVHKADFNANENLIRTASSRSSIKNLLQLVGVSLRGPIAAVADAKATIDADAGVDDEGVLIPATYRTYNIASPEDGGNLAFTLYKTVNGRVDTVVADGSFRLYQAESDDGDANKIFTNVVLQEGALVKETGTFDSTELVKTVQMTQSPVVEGSVEVFIDGDSNTSGAYVKVENIFFASGSNDKVFQVVSDDDFAGTVVFGDNKLGQSPRDGDVYTIFYRVGGGSRGNIKNSLINATIPTIGRVENISQGTGGADAETVEHAKKYAPLTFRRQDRLVTLQDIKTFGNTYIGGFGNVGKVTASVRRAFSSGNIIDVFVLEKANDFQLRRATPQFKLDMLDQMNLKKMLTSEIVILDGLIRTLDLIVTLRIDKELRGKEASIKLQARDAIQSFFSVDNNDFGKSLLLEDLNRKIFAIDDVRFSTIDNLKTNVPIDFNEIIQLNNLTINVVLV